LTSTIATASRAIGVNASSFEKEAFMSAPMTRRCQRRS